MQFIKGYGEHTNKEFLLMESILYTSPKFKKIITSMKDGRNPDPVARYFFSLMDNRDIKTDYNFLDLTDKPDSVRFLSDNQGRKNN